MKPYEPRRSIQPRSRWNATAYILLGLAWVVGFVGLAWIVVSIAASQAAPNPGSAAGLAGSGQPGTPRGVVSAVPPVATAGVPVSYAVLGAMVEAEIGSVLLGGKASWMPEKYGPDYLAMRLPKGTEVRICAATCLDMVVKDYGPSSRLYPDRIADIAVIRWEQICEIPRRWGICEITVEYGGGPRATLPPTDLAPETGAP